jgi:hypothetical protein
VVVPCAVGITVAEPPVGWIPAQSASIGLADAVHEVAFVLDQVRVDVSPKVTALGQVEIVTVGAGEEGALPPPHALMIPKLIVRVASSTVLFISARCLS